MRWNVEVADAKTGAERIVQIDADSAADAERIIRKKGMLVSAVHPSTVKTEAEQLDDMVAEATASAAAPPLNYATPRATTANSHRPIPDYKDIVRGMGFMNLFGTIVLAIGLLAIALGAAVMFWVWLDRDTYGFIGGLGAILYGCAMVSVGIFLRMNAALAGAIRDIARNSFRA